MTYLFGVAAFVRMVLDCKFAVSLFDLVRLSGLCDTERIVEALRVNVLGWAATATWSSWESTAHAREVVLVHHASKWEAATSSSEKHSWLVEFKK